MELLLSMIENCARIIENPGHYPELQDRALARGLEVEARLDPGWIPEEDRTTFEQHRGILRRVAGERGG